MDSKFAQRCLSFWMALVMVLSLTPLSALASEVEDTAPAETSEPVPVLVTPEAVQARIDALLASFGITKGMTDNEIANAIIMADSDTIQNAMVENEVLDQLADSLTDEQLKTMEVYTYARFLVMLRKVQLPALLATDSASLFNGKLSISSSTSHWSSGDAYTTVTGGTNSATITAKMVCGKWDFTGDTTTATVTLTNNYSNKAELSFSWSASNYTELSLGSATGSAVYTLESGASTSFTITRQASKNSTMEATITLSNITLTELSASSTITVNHDSTLGSVTVGNAAATSGSQFTVTAGNSLALVATVNSGATFMGWINEATNQILSSSASFTYTPATHTTIRAVFRDNSSTTGWWLVNNSYLFTDLNTAAGMDGASTVVLLNDAILPAGDYKIPAGVTLLIPYDAAGTLCTDKPTTNEVNIVNDGKMPSVFRMLTMANGANITVNGAISVSGSQSSCYGYNGMPYGPLGFIDMKSGSTITVNNGANLYVWGYITGSGSVEIKSGGTVHEHFQIADYRGGDATSSIAGKDDEYGVFPFNQYYIQNVEVPMTLHKGAVEKGRGSVTVKLAGVQALSIPFIGYNPGESMFVIQSGYIVKDYMEGTGRTEVKIYGDLSVSEVNLSMKVSLLGSLDIESSKYALPIPHHFTVSVESGSISMDQTMAFLPGSELYIREGATCTLGTGKKLYVYDLDQWLYNEGANGYSGTTNQPYMTVKYVPGGDGTTGRLKDALVQVDGTVDVSAGSAYVTSSGANIYSTGTGKVIVGSAPDTTVRQVITNGTDVSSWPEIPIVPAILQNAAGKDPASTNTAETTGTYVYRNGIWCPHTDTDYTDSDKNHKCDTCGTVMSACSDDNKDHKCDICGTVVSSCSDDNKDHKCDTCGMVMSQCSDVTSDGNHTCDICGADGITEHTMLNGVCTDCGAAYEAQIGSTYCGTLAEALDQVAEGATVTLLTNISGEITISQQVSIELGNYNANIQAGEGFTYAKNGTVITIGKAVLGIGAVNLRAGDSLDLFFYVKKTALANSGYADFYAKIERTKGGTVQPAETISYAQWEDYNETYVRFCYDGIAAKEMTDSVTVTVYSADGKPLSSAYTDSVQGYAMRMIRKGSSSAALKTALVDMLNYGAAAQTHFGFNTDNLANALVASEGFSDLATEETPACEKITGNPEAFYLGSVSVKNNLTFTFCFYGIDPQKNATAAYTDHYGKNKTPSGTFYTLTNEDGVAITYKGQTVYGVDIEDIAIADGRQEISCTVTGADGNEIQAVSSVESYLAYAMEEYPNETVFPMLAKFIDSAYTYFHQ